MAVEISGRWQQMLTPAKFIRHLALDGGRSTPFQQPNLHRYVLPGRASLPAF